MIHVFARVTLKPGMVPTFLREFRELAVLVRQEAGCLDYFPTQDCAMTVPGQEPDRNVVTVLEKWTHRQALEAHLRSGHMRGFQERVKDIVTDTRLFILEEV